MHNHSTQHSKVSSRLPWLSNDLVLLLRLTFQLFEDFIEDVRLVSTRVKSYQGVLIGNHEFLDLSNLS